jgi:hypothetical protein
MVQLERLLIFPPKRHNFNNLIKHTDQKINKKQSNDFNKYTNILQQTISLTISAINVLTEIKSTPNKNSN